MSAPRYEITAVDEGSGAPVVARLEVASSWWGRFRGLMLRRRLEPDEGLLIEGCKSIHMMFMRFPIDVIFIRGDGTVTNVARRVRPWLGLAFGGREARSAIELAAGVADGIDAGQRLRVESP